MLKEEIKLLFDLPFNDLAHKAHMTLRENFACVNEVEACTLVNIKSGRCPENCRYCPQSAHYDVDIEEYNAIEEDELIQVAEKAVQKGVKRLCMGAAWRNISDSKLPYVMGLVRAAKSKGLEVCATLGMATTEQLHSLKDAGLDYYNHNIDTSAEYYPKVVSTRSYSDRLKTLQNVRDSGLKMCCGGILGMGESREDRIAMIAQLASFDPQPESVPINMLVRVKGAPFEDMPPIDEIEFLRTVAVARVAIPKARVRLSAGRAQMSDVLQAFCFFVGANSIFYGDKLLTVDNSGIGHDDALLNKLNINFA